MFHLEDQIKARCEPVISTWGVAEQGGPSFCDTCATHFEWPQWKIE